MLNEANKRKYFYLAHGQFNIRYPQFTIRNRFVIIHYGTSVYSSLLQLKNP